VITFTTDFGTSDWFVGVMKGVALGIAPRARLVDITHDIRPGDVRGGAFALMAVCRYFPAGTVHVAVVDPGVGSQRRAIAVQTQHAFFVGPDNGVLSWALNREKVESIRQIENTTYFLKPLSRTFHGRDVFAPVAAHLQRGVSLKSLGRELHDYCRIPWPDPKVGPGQLRGEIVYVDRFGNGITNLEARPAAADSSARGEGRGIATRLDPRWLGKGAGTACVVTGRRKVHFTLAEFYAAVPPGEPVAVPGSSGFLELALNGGSAATQFGIEIGDEVIVS